LTRTAIFGALALLFLVVGCKPNGVLKHPTVLPIRISLGWTWQIRIRAGVESQVRVEVPGLTNVESHVRVKGLYRANVPVSVGFNPAVIPLACLPSVWFRSDWFRSDWFLSNQL
jgi:hypothetical protein